MNKKVFLPLWAVFVALYFIFAEKSLALCIIFKALPEMLIIAALAMNRNAIPKKVFVPVMCALAFSILGDTAGEFKFGSMTDWAFILQIFFFLIAQFCYTASFIRNIKSNWWQTSKLKLAGKAVAIVVILGYVIPVATMIFAAIDDMVFVIACCIYMGALLASGITSTLQDREGHLCFIFGAMLFIFSDSVIAINCFVDKVEHAGLLIMSTYFAAQLLLNITMINNTKDNEN